MIAKPTFELHPGAARDSTDIWEFIAAENPAAAKRVRENLLESIRKLAPFPNQGHLPSDLTDRPLRYLAVREYLAVCALDIQPLVVLAVLDGRRNPRIVAAILNARI
jgi:plasmid stabilization system protein ParE